MKKSKLRAKFEKFQRRQKIESKMNFNDRMMLVDATNQFIRIFATIKNVDSSGMMHAQGVMRFLKSLAFTIRKFRPTRCVVVFDGYGGSTRRRQLYSDYKNNRRTKIKIFEDEEVDEQWCLNRIFKYIQKLPLTMIILDGIEADDVIAYISKECYRDLDNETIIVSSDKDFLQLVSDDISVYSPVKKKLYDPAAIQEEYNLRPYNFIIYKIFEGDRSDNIDGIKGIGLKTLLKRFPYLKDDRVEIEDIIADARKRLDEGRDLKVFETIDSSEEQIYLNDKLMRLKDLNISANSKMKINTLVKKTSDLGLNYAKLNEMFKKEHAEYYIRDTENWLDSSFKRLVKYV